MRRPRKTRALLALTAAAAVLVLSGCSGGRLGAAAVIDGHEIATADVDLATRQLQTLDGASTIDRNWVVTQVILEPALVKYAAQYGVGVSDEQTAAFLKKVKGKNAFKGTASPTLLLALRSYLAQASIFGTSSAASTLAAAQTEAVRKAVIAEITQSDITINPRYGAYSLSGLSVAPPTTPKWLVSTAATK